MSKTLIITEKASLGNKIADVLGVKSKKDGFFENDKYRIIPCAGHILTLTEPKEYPELKNLKWQEYSLPFLPNNFLISKDSKKAKLYNAIKTSLKDSSITEVIHWCDPDREGQLIADELLEEFKNTKKTTRCWHTGESPKELKTAFDKRKNNDDYLTTFKAARARGKADWLIGMNATILATVKGGALLKLGRVMTPILQYIHDRDIEIENFKPEPYYVVINEKTVKLADATHFKDKADAQKLADELNKHKAVVTKVTKEDVVELAPLLYDLPELQKVMSNKHGFKMDKTMEVGQSVYDKGFISYIRADSKHLTDDEKGKIQDVINIANDNRLVFKPNSRVFNTKKVSAHSALHLTELVPNENSLTKDEWLLYNEIKNIIYANFTKDDRIVSKTSMEITVGDTKFKLSGKTVKQEGWGVFIEVNVSDNLPDLKEGDTFDVEFGIVDKMTTPPPKITTNSLLAWCLNPFSKDDEFNDLEYIEDDKQFENIKKGATIGTEATRSATVQKLEETGYIKFDKKSYSVTPLGREVIKVKDKLGIKVNKEQTVEIETWLNEVVNGTLSENDVIDRIKDRLKNTISNSNSVEIEKIQTVKGSEIKEICPKCGKPLIETPHNWQCSDHNNGKGTCSFILWTTQKFKENHKIKKTELKKLLKGDTIVMKAKSKAGKIYSAEWKYVEKDGKWNFELVKFV